MPISWIALFWQNKETMETEALKLTLKRELWKTKKHVILELKLNLGTKIVILGGILLHSAL